MMIDRFGTATGVTITVNYQYTDFIIFLFVLKSSFFSVYLYEIAWCHPLYFPRYGNFIVSETSAQTCIDPIQYDALNLFCRMPPLWKASS